jgi:hypothetical protein
MIECDCPDTNELQHRLVTRTPLRSQMRNLDEEGPDADASSTAERLGTHKWRTFGPTMGHLVIDTTKPFEKNLEEVMVYILTAQTKAAQAEARSVV